MCAPSETLRRLEPPEATAQTKDQGQGEDMRYKTTVSRGVHFHCLHVTGMQIVLLLPGFEYPVVQPFHTHMHAVPGCIISHWCIFQFTEGSRVEMPRLTLPISRRAAPRSTSCLHYRHFFSHFPHTTSS